MKNLNKYIDHTLLKPEAVTNQIKQLCHEAKQYNFASVMVNSSFVKNCVDELKETDVKIATVIGFPLGACSTHTKLEEVKQALLDGANEFDMVINIGKLKEGKTDEVIAEIKAIRALIPDVVLKVIIETCLLTNEEKILACHCVTEAKTDYIKTSTGFSISGATVEDVKLLKKHVGDKVLVKAAGGVRSYEDMIAMIDAGASRIGTSSGVSLMQGNKSEDSY